MDVHMVNGQQQTLQLGALLLRVKLARTAVKAQRLIALTACTVSQALLNISNAQQAHTCPPQPMAHSLPIVKLVMLVKRVPEKV